MLFGSFSGCWHTFPGCWFRPLLNSGTRAEVEEDSLFPPYSLPDPTQHKLKQSNKFIFVHFSKIPKNLPLDIL
jgi:hypothetical protein